MLQITYSCNDQGFDGLFLSILSILRRTSKTCSFYVLTADLSYLNADYKPLSTNHIQILNQVIKAFNKDNQLNIIDCTQIYKNTLGDKYDVKHFTPYALFRLLLDQIHDIKGLVLYLDIDTMANGDISLAWEVDMNNVEICVCKDYFLNQTKIAQLPMFNSGVMLINLDKVRETKYFNKAIEYLIKYKPIMADQQALYHTWTKIKVWQNEGRFNYQKLGIEKDTVIKHFCTTPSNVKFNKVIKPWNVYEVQNVLNLHNWDEDYNIYLQLKPNWD